jgi:osmotically-inducible protein OsmY
VSDVEEPPDYLVEHVLDALAKDPRVNELELDVALTGGKVFVSGTVASEARRRAVTEVVREMVPDREVVNQTSVLSVSPHPAPERLS